MTVTDGVDFCVTVTDSPYRRDVVIEVDVRGLDADALAELGDRIARAQWFAESEIAYGRR